LTEINYLSILIADSGSSKADWVLFSDAGETRFRTAGFNPYFFTPPQLAGALITDVVPPLRGITPDAIYFYSAGCAAQERKDLVREGLRTAFQQARIEINDDLLGAARGLLQQQAGFIAILGTGMNNGWYDGTRIVKQVDSLGFILGDEGSGTAIGKRVITAFLRGQMPDELRRPFYDTYQLHRDDIIRLVYGGKEVNRFIAGFARFAGTHLRDPFVKNLVSETFRDFCLKIVSAYPEHGKATFNCAGSVGFQFSEILSEVIAEFGMKPGKIVQSPMDGLVQFHSK
jgi:N-acetylglucosamine kinase-like BadF-type ATPase